MTFVLNSFVSWCGTAKIKTRFTNRLNKLTWFITVCQTPRLKQKIGCDLHWWKRTVLTKKAVATHCFLLAFLPRYDEKSQVDSLGAIYSLQEGLPHLYTEKLVKVGWPWKVCFGSTDLISILFTVINSKVKAQSWEPKCQWSSWMQWEISFQETQNM
jgi:hypothetical protein